MLGKPYVTDHVCEANDANARCGPSITDDQCADHESSAIDCRARRAASTGGQSAAEDAGSARRGHLRCRNLTTAGLCDFMDKPRTVEILRSSTGTRGEQEFTAHMATHQMNVMNATGVLDARAIDCTFSKADYIDFKPHLVIAHHIHRDGKNRAMFAVPDSLIGYHTAAANAESVRLMARVVGGYTKATGIPVMQDLATLRMRQLYTCASSTWTRRRSFRSTATGTFDADVLFGSGRLARALHHQVCARAFRPSSVEQCPLRMVGTSVLIGAMSEVSGGLPSTHVEPSRS